MAREHFQKELQTQDIQLPDSTLVVILHDACYGHRYARPKTSKGTLNTIVERPERIKATVLGVSAAYVRLGGRHAKGSYPPGHVKSAGLSQPPFKIQKSSRAVSLTSPAVTQVHGMKWMAELKAMCEGAEAKLALNGKELTRPHAKLETDEEKPKLHEGDLYLCSESLNAFEGALGGVCDAVDTIFSGSASKRAFVCVRPPGHHCSDSYPSGFCWLNNVHVGISHASIMHGLTHAAIIDFDLHHGDGSQAITWAHNARVGALPKNVPISKKTAIGYFSLHDINSYPCEWGDEEKVQNASLCIENSHYQTIWNVHLQPWKSDNEFWTLYEDRYSVLLDKTRSFLRNHCEKLTLSSHSHKPISAIFISAGFDASEWESPGMQRHKVNVPTDFYARFTRDIVNLANEDGLGVEGRVISVLEGGYSDRALTSGVLSHICGLSSTPEVKTHDEMSNGLAAEMGRRLGKLSINGERHSFEPSATQGGAAVDSHWWSLSHLEELEAIVYPAVPVAPARKTRPGAAPTYNTPTQSFTAKIVSPTTRRSLSGNAYLQRSSSSASSRPPTPPLPEVDWATAAHELCNLLIPADRETGSCKAEDLNAEATRVRRNRQSTVGINSEVLTTDTKPMHLRDRKPRSSNIKTENEEVKPVSKAARRKTVAAGVVTRLDGTDEMDLTTKPVHGAVRVPTRRRVSVASTALSSIDDGADETGSDIARKNENNGPITSTAIDSTDKRTPSFSSIRVEPSTSTRPQIAVMKKTRAPAKPKQPAQVNPVKKISKPSVPPSYLTTFGSNKSPINSNNGSVVSSERGTASTVAVQQNLDHLSAGMKKMSIKLNVPTQDAPRITEVQGQPVKEAPRKLSAGEAGRKESAIPAARGSSVTIQPVEPVTRSILPLVNTIAFPPRDDLLPRDDSVSPPQPMGLGPGPSYMLNAAGSRVNDHLPSSFAPPAVETIPAPAILPDQSTVTHSSEAQVPPPGLYSNSSQQEPALQPFVPDQSVKVQESVLPPAMIHSTPKRTKQDFPVFTATSPIIFGQPSLGARYPDAVAEAPPSDLQNYNSNNPTIAVKIENNGSVERRKQTKDIWGVPDTPRQQMP